MLQVIMGSSIVAAVVMSVVAHPVDDDCVRGMGASAPANYDPKICFPLSNVSSMPAQCLAPTWSIDPPCPRCWANEATDYVPGTSPTTLSPELRTRLRDQLSQYLDRMRHQRPPSHADSGTVFTGVGGRALLYLKLHEATGDPSFLEEATPYVEAMIGKLAAQKRLDRQKGATGFQWSYVGMSCVGALAADRVGDAATTAAHVAEVQEAFAGEDAKYDDFDSGGAGLLYAARFLQSNLAPSGAPLIDRELVLGLAMRIIDRGSATAAAHGHPGVLLWHGPNDSGLWLGQSHGVAGVVTELLAVPELLTNKTAVGYLRRTLDWVVAQQFESGNFPSEYYNATQDWLVQWDHGAPGVSAALLAGWRAFGEGAYRSSAERALECVWKRGLLLKGLMNCHGIGGNIWMQLFAAKLTGDLKYRYRALAFQETVLGSPLLSDLDQMRQPQPLPNAPWGFWTGSVESSIELWTDLLYRGPANASMTGWEATL